MVSAYSEIIEILYFIKQRGSAKLEFQISERKLGREEEAPVREAASIIYAPYARHQKYIIISRFELEGSEQLNSPVLFNQTLSLESDFLKHSMFFSKNHFNVF